MQDVADVFWRRKFLQGFGSCSFLTVIPCIARADDIFGQKLGYPTGWGPAGQRQQWEGYTQYHVGNFSGGLEKMFPSQKVRHSGSASLLKTSSKIFNYKYPI
jgi:hypothetical protein